MSGPLLIYQLLVLAVLVVLLGLTVVNMVVLPRLEKYSDDARPDVAVLVPARNEEANIESCLRSLLAQDYPALSVWLYDDASIDRTPEIAARLVAEYAEREAGPRITVIRGDGDPPPGWLGKANACHRLYSALRMEANPDYLLFTDADVRFEPAAISHAVATASATRAGLLSVFPRQVTITWAERLAVPVVLHWGVYGILPLPLAFRDDTGAAFAAANGQFMLFTHDAYQACGGHISVRDEILEDVALSREVKRAGHRAMLADSGPLVHTRMYDSPAALWEGYSKNLYSFFGNSPFFLLVGVAVLLILYVIPALFVLVALLSRTFTLDLFYLPLAQYLVAVAIRMVLAGRFKYRPLDAFLNPAAMLYLAALAINSMAWSLTGRGGWKGRTHVPAGR